MKKKTISMFGLALLSLASFIPSVQVLALSGPWGPERPTFTWEKPATYATFNSMTNNPTLGDERNFVRIRAVGDTYYVDEVKLQPGKIYEVYSYYHNNAEANVGQTAIGIADNARMSSNFPATIRAGEKLTVNTIISAADTDPLAVWDGAYVTADADLYLRYVPGSAKIHNGGQLNGQAVGPDYLFSNEGALLGYNNFSGILPGCSGYAGYVTYQFKADKPDFNVTKTITSDTSNVGDGTIVEFKVRYDNTGTMTQDDVVVRDTLPSGLEYIPGSTTLKNNSNPGGSTVSDNIVSSTGINIGDYAGGNGWAELTYKAKVQEGVACDARLTNRVVVSTADGSKEATSEVIINGDACVPSELPQTGPGEVALAVIAVLSIGVGGTYWYRSRRALKKVSQDIEG
jgi:fimbrial isopeptide formation D2 family protein